jgi:hypothetical protein
MGSWFSCPTTKTSRSGSESLMGHDNKSLSRQLGVLEAEVGELERQRAKIDDGLARLEAMLAPAPPQREGQWQV